MSASPVKPGAGRRVAREPALNSPVNSRLSSGWWAIGIAGLGILCYLNTLPNDFTYDDNTIVVKSERIRDLTKWREVWLTDWWEVDKQSFAARKSDRLYRPLTVFSFAINYALGDPQELHAFDYHLVNVVLHGATAGLVWLLIRRLDALSGAEDTAGALTAIACGALFAVHPIHCEAVASVVGRADLLAAASVVGGLLCFLSDLARPSWTARVATAALFAAALMSKESGAILLAWIVICDFWMARRGRESGTGKRRRRVELITRYLLLGAVIVAYLLLRNIACRGAVLHTSESGSLDNPLVEATLAERFWTPFKLLAVYIWVMVWPAKLSVDYSFEVIPLAGSLRDGWAIVGLAIVASCVTAVVWGWRRRTRTALALLLFGGSYFMFANGPKLLGTLVAERLFYLPSLPVCWLLSMGLLRLATRRPHTQPTATWCVVFAGIVAALGIRTLIRNRDWRNNDALFASSLAAYPSSARLQAAVGQGLIAAGKAEEGLDHVRRAIRMYPSAPAFYHAMSQGYWKLNRLEEAEQAAATAVGLSPGDREHADMLAAIRRRRGVGPTTTRASLSELAAAAERNPDDFDSQYRLALARIDDGDPPKAVEALTRAVAINPDRVDARLELAVQLFATDERQAAAIEFRSVLARDPQNWRAHTNLAVVLALAGQVNEALRHAVIGRDLAPDQFQTWLNLAQVHAKAKHFDEALSLYHRIRAGLAEDDPNRAVVDGCIEDLDRQRR